MTSDHPLTIERVWEVGWSALETLTVTNSTFAGNTTFADNEPYPFP